ncbi:probable tubulin polyglutamylase ttll-15 [Stegodyphus dumicola]|uniref:probable tubulin polyglutamylase ttll-15 n=1 Tax=Stegodyphus dumicola TaxID=202533 RepID=UPI0015A9DCC2|nr:probable tubulin polyglutamylase ttll-15 [Stegodyphus dumicola]
MMWRVYCFRDLYFLKYFRLYIAFFVCLLLTLYITLNYTNKNQVNVNCLLSTTERNFNYFLPVVRIYGIQEWDKSLDVVKETFKQMGYIVEIGSTTNWDVLWSYTYPFHTLERELAFLKPTQKVNHFPGSGFITQKMHFAMLPINHIPKSFQLPAGKNQFLEYVATNIEKTWVLKNPNHRGIRLLNGTESLDASGYLIQEFVSKPLLISGKFSEICLGVYVMQTSIDPLRVYVYSGDVLLRFCKKDYYPLNPNDFESYIVGDDYLPVWEVPDIKYYYSELNLTAKDSLNAYLHSLGKGTKKIWSQIYETILDVYFETEADMKRSAMILGNLRNFFELVRFDFILDENLNIYLLEVNMSPNLSPAHFPQNRLLYEQVLFNSLSLVGLVRKFPTNSVYRGEAEVSEKDIQVYPEQCASAICRKSCKNIKCITCNQCMNRELREIAKAAYREFLNRGKYQRVIPPSVVQGNELIIRNPDEVSEMNLFMDTWFKGKCLQG